MDRGARREERGTHEGCPYGKGCAMKLARIEQEAMAARDAAFGDAYELAMRLVLWRRMACFGLAVAGVCALAALAMLCQQ